MTLLNFDSNKSESVMREEKKITDVRRVMLNGREVKLFKVWVMTNSTWVFDGQYSAPARTANKNLLDFAL
jgi:hypothetical protein